MKKLVLYCLLFTGFLKAQSPAQHPFPTDSAAWYDISFHNVDWLDPITEFSKFYIDGDTIINGEQFQKVMRKRKYSTEDYLYSIQKVDSNKMMVKYFNEFVDTALHVLYNYNLQIGDSFSVKGEWWQAIHWFQCVSIDSALTNTGYRKQWNLLFLDQCASIPDLDTLKWIEGATSNYGLYYDASMLNCGATDTYDGNRTECFVHRDIFVLGGGFASCEYLLNDIPDNRPQPQISIFPNPANTEFTIKVDAPTQTLSVNIINITGQQVSSYAATGNQLTIGRNNLPAGMYLLQINAGNRLLYHKIVLE